MLDLQDIHDYKIGSSGTFSLRIPAAEYGRSLNDFVFEPSPPGWHQAYCQGYFFMVEGFKSRPESYFIFSMARGAPYAAGEYYASFVYEIKVLPSSLRPRSSQSGNFPERVINTITTEIGQRKEKNEIGDIESKLWTGIIGECKETQNNFVQNSIDSRAEAGFQSVGQFLLNNFKRKVEIVEVKYPKVKVIIPKIDELKNGLRSSQNEEGKPNPLKWSETSPKDEIKRIVEQIGQLEEEMQKIINQENPVKNDYS